MIEDFIELHSFDGTELIGGPKVFSDMSLQLLSEDNGSALIHAIMDEQAGDFFIISYAPKTGVEDHWAYSRTNFTP